MAPDGSWGDQIVDGNIVFNEGTATTAVQQPQPPQQQAHKQRRRR
jgi:hypothetical protein